MVDGQEESRAGDLNRFDFLGRPVTRRTLLIGAIALAVLIPSCVCCLGMLLAGDYVLAEFDCGHGRSILLYADNFCDQADIPLYEVRQGSRVVAPKFCTTAIFDCGHILTAKDFKLVTREGGNLAAVVWISQGEPILIYDFASGKSWPRGDSDPSDELDLKKRLAVDAATGASE